MLILIDVVINVMEGIVIVLQQRSLWKGRGIVLDWLGRKYFLEEVICRFIFEGEVVFGYVERERIFQVKRI